MRIVELSYPLMEPDSLDSTETHSNTTTTTATTTTIVYLDHVDDIIFSVRTDKDVGKRLFICINCYFLRMHMYLRAMATIPKGNLLKCEFEDTWCFH